MEHFSEAITEEAGISLESSGMLLLNREYQIGNEGCVALAKDKKAVLFSIPSGVFSGSNMLEAAAVAERVNGELRLSVEQSFFVICDADQVGTVKGSSLYEEYRRFHNVYFSHQIACAGTATCKFGVIPNKPDAIEMAEFLDGVLPVDSGKIRMHWSACPKGCGIHGIADIGFEGCKAKDSEGNSCFGVHIFVGGKASFEAKEARRLYKAIALSDAKIIVQKLVKLYLNERHEGESFEMFDTRVLAAMANEELVDKIDTTVV